ncbi:MAG: hypothetical protein COW01_12935 [Bdellovibrionales bacterium CG12_big_fil_rev_8_21_14_0_65_38_15]|nr:MAG: hypothetical protein COW79_08685 [Bdellovibrionales bacterium CG22_combo_CG10-13_8_21_14_all_38_13]PIQ53528.1 MAG: hypothetical protein COW01_12935 [Bdellovibrionales bacterium CG12_big_fil_rev_8_21_14_0_65_38_15]PIR28468.1 MAG: hypothetical protein COV38_15705 [Bdellovibrionales bacterium CG11_big_fil_rev_8_21_14_0_20_38_13]
MKLIFIILIMSSLVGCQEKKSVIVTGSSSVQSHADIDLTLEKDEACDTPEITEEKIVEQAMKPAKANAAGALQGATDCVVE